MAKINNPRRKRATRNPDHARRTHVAGPSDEAIEQRLHELVKPAVYAELDYYRRLGLRNRLLNLPTMVAVVLALIWRRGAWGLHPATAAGPRTGVVDPADPRFATGLIGTVADLSGGLV
jgi:hypothetical protein